MVYERPSSVPQHYYTQWLPHVKTKWFTTTFLVHNLNRSISQSEIWESCLVSEVKWIYQRSKSYETTKITRLSHHIQSINDTGITSIFLAFDFCRFCVVIRVFIPATTANVLRLRFVYQTLSITLFSYVYPWERASISLFNVECNTRELLVPFL